MVKVVIVEDEDILRNEIVLTTPWADLGCELFGEAGDGIAGAALIKKVRPDLVITDIRMPGLDGISMLNDVQKAGFSPCAIILTGHSDFEYAREALRIGVRDYILKPVDDEEFHDLIRKTARFISAEKKERDFGKSMRIIHDSRISFFSEYSLPERSGSQEFYVGRAVDYIKKNYRDDIALRDIAKAVGISQGYLSRIFREMTGYSFLEYLTCYRIRKAMKLLKCGEMNSAEAAAMTGFHDLSYFTQLFKKYVGITPGRYRTGGG